MPLLLCPMTAPRKKPIALTMAGFTMIELLVVMTIVAIFMAMALPQFGGIVAGNKIMGQSNLLLGILNYSRAEAVRRDIQLAVCPLNVASNGCASASGGSTDWSYGALVFQDNDHSGSYSAAKELRRLPLLDSSAANVIKVTTTPALITFREDGHTNLAGTTSFSVFNCSNKLKSSVELSVFGRSRAIANQTPTSTECP